MPTSPASTPRALGYRMPAEWEPHRATWLAWPHHRADWPGKFAPIPWIYAEIVRLLSSAERVCLLVQDAKARAEVRELLLRAGVPLARVEFHRQATDRVWTRDSGPTFLRGPKGARAICDWKFNAWAKYRNWTHDDQLPAYIARQRRLPSFQPALATASGAPRRIVLEGGSIDVDGRGLLLTTEECLLSPVQARNPGVSRAALERVLGDHLGIERVLWLERGIAGDDTHGHIDDLARFVRPGAIAIASEARRADENHAPLRKNLARLKAFRDLRGQPFDIAELPLPAPVVFAGQRLPASYANFYIANCGVLVPVFNDPNDTRALKQLEQLIPDRPVIPVYCRDLVWGLGTLHCMTQQEPA